MNERGSAAYALIVFMVIVFVSILIYTTLSKPIDEVTGAFENATTKVPSGVWGAIDTVWALWPIVLVIVAAAWVIVWAYRREHELAYRAIGVS